MESSPTILLAIAAGILSFVSPCVLPLVPAYLGQLTAVQVAASGGGARPSRWTAVRHAAVYVLGFGAIFTILGVTATFMGGFLVDYMRPLRIIGGAILVIMGLSLAGILKIAALERAWRPLDAGAAAGVTELQGSTGMALAPAGGAGVGGKVGKGLVGGKAGYGASFMLGAVFAIGWTPCIGPMLGGILLLASASDTQLQGALLLVAYTLGLGLPFIAIAAFYDRSRTFMRFLVRHGRIMSLVGGLLVAAIGLAMMFDVLTLLPRYFQFVPAL
jgi:cytochrome c-type biogenesis protein